MASRKAAEDFQAQRSILTGNGTGRPITPGTSMHLWGNMGGMWASGGGFLSMVPMLLLWILVIVGIFFVARMLMGRRSWRDPDDGALRILKERYARGEIQTEEFEQKKRDLSR